MKYLILSGNQRKIKQDYLERFIKKTGKDLFIEYGQQINLLCTWIIFNDFFEKAVDFMNEYNLLLIVDLNSHAPIEIRHQAEIILFEEPLEHTDTLWNLMIYRYKPHDLL